jgi:hypothetical protein
MQAWIASLQAWLASLLPSRGSLVLARLQVADTTVLATMFRKDGDWDMAWDPDIAFVTSKDFFKSFSTGGQRLRGTGALQHVMLCGPLHWQDALA